MSQAAKQGKSSLFWLLIAVGAGCAVCSGVTLLTLLVAGSSTDGPPMVGAGEALPRGETPDLFPGTPGFLPSGRGVSIPDADLVDGRPEGLWWRWQMDSFDKAKAEVTLFLADGTCATHPRPGAGFLFDLEGQRAQRGNTGVGTCAVSDGTFTRQSDGFTSTDSFESGTDGDGAFFKVGQARSSPMTAPTAEQLVGTWKESSGAHYVFSAGGAFGSGTWRLEGYLLELHPSDRPGWISTVGMTGDSFLIMNGAVYSRQ